jgi:hypothetical protein
VSAPVETRRAERLPCQVCGRPLVPLRDGTSRNHVPRRGGHYEDYCQGSGHRLARWLVGQRLRHHGGSVWEVVEDVGGRWDDYVVRCVVGARSFDGDRWLEAPGKTMRVHGEYVHRHGWTPVDDVEGGAS